VSVKHVVSIPNTVRRRFIGLVGLVAIGVGGCTIGGTSTPGAQDHSILNMAAVEPFTGPDAAFGPLVISGCFPATKLIADAGGILGHQVNCMPVDTRGDPADAVPAVRQMLATTSHLVGVIGPSSDEATPTIPLIQAASVPLFTNTGEATFDNDTNPFFHRLFPGDDLAGYAMALWGHKKGYSRGAAIFGNDVGSQGTKPTLVKAFTKLGGQIVVDESLALGQSNYRTEIQTMLSKNPDVIFTELDPQSSATFFSELQQLNGFLPVIGADPTLQVEWFNAVAPAVGAANLQKYFTAENPATPAPSGPAWEAFHTALLASASNIPNASQYSDSDAAEIEYDSVNIMALAMLSANSVDPKVFNSHIDRILAGSSSATKVLTFQEGKTALAAGKAIQYVGVTGPFLLNKYHNAPGNFDVDHFDGSGNLVKDGVVLASDVVPLTT
jgi:branched-chain amino acid transport system substrate-binding protein